MPEAIQRQLGAIAVLNLLVVCAALVVIARVAMARPPADVPGRAQNAAELALGWFVDQARTIDPRGIRVIAPFLGTLFAVILGCNLLAIVPVPIVGFPPTAYFSGPLALALVAVLGALAIGVRLRGSRAGLVHLVWPNPLQLVSEVSHALSLSLRLYGNIGGELIVAALVTRVVPWGIPLVVHALGLVPTVVQPFVFTLLTANFLATALHGQRERAHAPGDRSADAPGGRAPEPGGLR